MCGKGKYNAAGRFNYSFSDAESQLWEDDVTQLCFDDVYGSA